MNVFVVTGGIACGKSTLCRMLKDALPSMVFFDSDQAVHRLFEGDHQMVDAIGSVFGGDAISVNHSVDRSYLRKIVFDDSAARRQLEEIVHPRVRQECLDSMRSAAKQGATLFAADVPLYYETHFDLGPVQVLLAASLRSTQISRLGIRNRFRVELSEAMISAQLPLQTKIALADRVFWNEGPLQRLCSQVRRFSYLYS